MSTPTDEEIICVKQNLRNLIDFNNLLYTEGNTKILNAYLLLSISDDKDLGLAIGVNLLKGAFIALGDLGDSIGIIAGNFACGILDSYIDNTPESLKQQMSNLITRFQKTSEQLKVDFEMYYNDPATYWNTTFSGSVTNAFGTYPVSCKFSDLATIKFPAQTDSLFMNYILKAQYALDQQTWYTLLINFKITQFLPSTIYACKSWSQAQMDDNAGFYSKHKSYWNNWIYHHSTNWRGNDDSYYEKWENSIGGDANSFSDAHLNDGACDYLFIDSDDNVIINANGLFNRSFVFTKMINIPHTTFYSKTTSIQKSCILG
jgi:hypothetical protein